MGAGTISVATPQEVAARKMDWAAQDREEALKRAQKEENDRRENKGFTQVYAKGWDRLDALLQERPQAARMYAFLAKNIDPGCGAVVASQEVLAEHLGIAQITVRRLSKWLEDRDALVRIRVGSGVYAYALDPEEVWKSYNGSKEYAAFVTKTLVKKSDKENAQVNRRLNMMMKETHQT